MEPKTPQDKEHKVDPGGIFCLFGISICIIFGLAIGIIISQENTTTTKENYTPTPLPPPTPHNTEATLNTTEAALNTTETPITAAGNISDDSTVI